MKDIKIIVATHKKYEMPKDTMYIPLQVGADGKDDIGYTKDNTGENISIKNPFFCELTGMYWAWKNIDAEYIGLVHYRRHFSFKKKTKNKFDNILSKKEADLLLSNNEIVLPRKRYYVIETLYNHYKHTMFVEPLDKTRDIIEELYPEYLSEFDKLKCRRSAHMFNMFIMKKNIFSEYSKWLFDILFELEKRMKEEGYQYNAFHSRFYGRISELLLDVYIRKNLISYKEIKFIYMENINVVAKVIGFLKAKYGGEKYGKSF